MLSNALNRDVIIDRLDPVVSTFEIDVVPQQVELLDNNSYAPDYAWMYSFEKRLKYRIQDLLKFRLAYNQEKILFGAGGVFSEGLSNAFVHGHRKNPNLPITVWSAVSRKGLGFAISDQGSGFDFNKIMSDFTKGGNFFHIAGNGFSTLSSSKSVEAGYLEEGTSLCLIYLF